MKISLFLSVKIFEKEEKKCLQRIGGYFPGFEIELKAEGLNLPEREKEGSGLKRKRGTDTHF